MKMGAKRADNQNQKEILHNEERGLQEFDTHDIPKTKRTRGKRDRFLTNLCKWMTERDVRRMSIRQTLWRAMNDH